MVELLAKAVTVDGCKECCCRFLLGDEREGVRQILRRCCKANTSKLCQTRVEAGRNRHHQVSEDKVLAHKAKWATRTDLRELRDKDKWYEGEGRIQWAQRELVCENWMWMEDQRKKELAKQLRKLGEFTDMPQNVDHEQKEKWRQELQDIEQRRNDLMPEHQQIQKRSQKLQSLQDRKNQCQKNMGKWAEENEDLRSVIDDSHGKMEVNGQKIQSESFAEAELDLEIRGLQAGDDRQGSSASQSNGCCFDTSIFQ